MRIMKSGTDIDGYLNIIQKQGTWDELSRFCKEGHRYRLFLPAEWSIDPITQEEVGKVMSVTVTGRDVDFDIFNTSFVRLDDYEETDVGKIIDRSLLSSCERIGNIMYDALYKQEVEEKKRRALELAEKMEEEVDSVQLGKDLKSLEIEYYGEEPSPGVDRKYPTKNRLISPFKPKCATEAIIVEVMENTILDWKNAKIVSITLTPKKAARIKSLSMDPTNWYNPRSTLFEIDYNYDGVTKEEAGRNAVFEGVKKEYSLWTIAKDQLASGKFQELYNMLSKRPEDMGYKNRRFAGQYTMDDIILKFQKYLIKHRYIVKDIDFEENALARKCARDLLEMAVVNEVKGLRDKLISIVEEDSKLTPADTEETTNALSADSVSKLKEATSIDAVAEVYESDKELAAAMSDIDELEEDGTLEV